MLLLLVILKARRNLNSRAISRADDLREENTHRCHGEQTKTTFAVESFKLRIISTLAVMIRDKPLLAYVVFIVFIAAIESQTDTILPLYIVNTLTYDFWCQILFVSTDS